MGVETPDSDSGGDPSAARVMLGLVALLAADRDERVEDIPPRRSELVLADAGFTVREVATLTSRKCEAVRSSLRRRAPKASSGKGTPK